MMKTLSPHIFYLLAVLLYVSSTGNAQSNIAITPRATAYTTGAQTVTARLKKGEQNQLDFTVKASFTIESGNSDDTLTGVATYSISDEDRQRIANQIGASFTDFPGRITRRNVIATFQKDTAPPVIHLLISEVELEVANTKIQFGAGTLGVNAREVSTTAYTEEEVEALLTIWARQILSERPRRGIINRLNRVIRGER